MANITQASSIRLNTSSHNALATSQCSRRRSTISQFCLHIHHQLTLITLHFNHQLTLITNCQNLFQRSYPCKKPALEAALFLQIFFHKKNRVVSCKQIKIDRLVSNGLIRIKIGRVVSNHLLLNSNNVSYRVLSCQHIILIGRVCV